MNEVLDLTQTQNYYFMNLVNFQTKNDSSLLSQLFAECLNVTIC